MPPKKQKYTHLSQRNQILKRPGQHIGSIKNTVQEVWLAETIIDNDTEVEHIVKQEISHNPGLMHIFYEVLGNAQDNYFRSKNTDTPQKKIDITVNQETGQITIWNDGLWIPTTLHEWKEGEEIIDTKDHYETELLFGQLNSSGNYDDENNARTGGGLHGHGVKLTNIFSSMFRAETFDPETQLKFVGEWYENMSKMTKPKITTCKQKKGYTKVSYTADFSRFGLDGYTDEHLAVMKKLCIDCAMITGQKVYFNGEVLPVKTLIDYVKYYTNGNCVEFKSKDSSVVLCEKATYESGIVQMSWVNGINTSQGGLHVDLWKKAIFKPLLDKIKTKYSKGKQSNPLKITAKTLEQYFILFVRCNLENPDFKGQTKDALSSPAPIVNVPTAKITSLMRWKFIADIEETIRIQGMKELKKTDGKKTTSVHILKADDANKAGTVKSSQCTLFITEGLSAKSFAATGISAIENGTDWFGILPVRGKFLNVRGATSNKINDNNEITNLKKMLGLQHGVDYSAENAFRSLRYGKVRILTDADPDGDHIKGLLLNFFQYFFPSLIENDYITALRTPIVKATIGKKVISFYSLPEFKTWANKQTKKFIPKYFKGLGTSKDEDILEIFEKPRYVQFISDKKTADTVSMVFDKKRADDRKIWLEKYTEEDHVYDVVNNEEQVPVSDFFNNEMIGFSIYDNKRSIPSVVDGFKPSQRKAMWVGLKVLNHSTDLKVAQFAARVADLADYHHGEKSMEEAIVGMAQTFVGSNNIALLYEAGQFGTRLAGGEDHAACRYLHTRLASIVRYILRKEDDPILEYLEDEGKQLEPRYFVPIVPMLLVNGCIGIGTGYATHVPAYNPLELVDWIRLWLEKVECVDDDDDNDDDEEYPELIPWYRGFTGATKSESVKRVAHYGQVRSVGKDCYEITELPVGMWTDNYKEHLNELKSGVTKEAKTGYDAMKVAQLKEELSMREQPVSGTKAVLIARLKQYDKENGTSAKKMGNSGQLISKWEWHGDVYKVKFKVWTKSNVHISINDPKFKLKSLESLSNMTAFTPAGGIKAYAGVNEIMRTFCRVRYEYYQKRKNHLLAVLELQLNEAKAKVQFITEVLDDFELLKQTEAELFEYLEDQGYWQKTDDEHCYSYLTNMAIKTFTTDHQQKLLDKIKELKEEIAYIKKRTAKQMWTVELDEFVKAYHKWVKEIEIVHTKLAKKKIKRRI